jgi:mono/diheme cytochrome c family protein
LRTLLVLATLILIPFLGCDTAQSAKSQAPPKGSAEKGQRIFEDDCSICHYADRADNKLGPGMKGLFKNQLLPVSHKPATEENIREQISKGNPQGKPMPMPAFGDQLNAEQMDDLVAYLKTL